MIQIIVLDKLHVLSRRGFLPRFAPRKLDILSTYIQTIPRTVYSACLRKGRGGGRHDPFTLEIAIFRGNRKNGTH